MPTRVPPPRRSPRPPRPRPTRAQRVAAELQRQIATAAEALEEAHRYDEEGDEEVPPPNQPRGIPPPTEDSVARNWRRRAEQAHDEDQELDRSAIAAANPVQPVDATPGSTPGGVAPIGGLTYSREVRVDLATSGAREPLQIWPPDEVPFPSLFDGVEVSLTPSVQTIRTTIDSYRVGLSNTTAAVWDFGDIPAIKKKVITLESLTEVEKQLIRDSFNAAWQQKAMDAISAGIRSNKLAVEYLISTRAYRSYCQVEISSAISQLSLEEICQVLGNEKLIGA